MSDQGGQDGEPRNALALVATLVYGLFFMAAVLWLYFRDRQLVLAELALGDFESYSALISLSIGTAVGLGTSGVIWLLVRYLKAFGTLEERLRGTVGELGDAEILAISMASAIGEEMFFRGALQDWAGPYWTALVFGLLHTGPGLLLWGVVAGALGLVFGLMVHTGCGLLSVTVAHALINYISLRRMSLS